MVFIKKIVMQGFLSYKNETTFSDFDQQVNVIGLFFKIKFFFFQN